MLLWDRLRVRALVVVGLCCYVLHFYGLVRCAPFRMLLSVRLSRRRRGSHSHAHARAGGHRGWFWRRRRRMRHFLQRAGACRTWGPSWRRRRTWRPPWRRGSGRRPDSLGSLTRFRARPPSFVCFVDGERPVRVCVRAHCGDSAHMRRAPHSLWWTRCILSVRCCFLLRGCGRCTMDLISALNNHNGASPCATTRPGYSNALSASWGIFQKKKHLSLNSRCKARQETKPLRHVTC